MAKKVKQAELIKCKNCTHAGSIKGLSVWCDINNIGRVANSPRICNYFKNK